MANTNSTYLELQSQKLVMLTCLGTLVHWYDFYIFSFIASWILRSYYQTQSQSLVWLSVIGLAVGLLVRPLGALYFSPQMDRVGRRALFSRSLNVMLVSNIILVLAPFSLFPLEVTLAVLLLTRVLQGVSLTMEYGAAANYIYESVATERRGFYLGLLQITAPIGFGLALGAQYYGVQIFSTPWFAQGGGWRILVLLGLPLVILSRKIRHDLAESPEFLQLERRQALDLRKVWPRLRAMGWQKLAFLTLAFGAPQGASYYFAHFYFGAYFDSKYAPFYLIGAITLCWPLAWAGGALSDKVSPIKLWHWSLIVLWLLLALLLVLPIGQKVLMVLIYGNSLLIYGLVSRLLIESFPLEQRGLGISLPYHIGNGIFGGLMGLMGLWLGAGSQSQSFRAAVFCWLIIGFGGALSFLKWHKPT